jgi:hypothetical protein
LKCPNGYVKDSTGAIQCRCICSDVSTVCASGCKYGNTIDATTQCQTCDCNPPPTDACTPVTCTSNCGYGYKIDANGCKTCECLPAPTCNSLVACPDIKCAYGYAKNADGCDSCQCNACPAVNCSRATICAYGVKSDASGCQVCDCADAPPTTCSNGATPVSTSNTGSAAPSACNLMCSFGYIVDGGCIQCKCRDSPKCDCGVKPSGEVLCSDTTTKAGYTNNCVVYPNNTCAYYYKRCPIGVVLTLTKGTFTSSDLTQFLSLTRISLNDVTFTVKVDPATGSQIVTFWVNPDSVPAGSTDKNVLEGIKTSATLNGNEGTAYLISEAPSTPATGFGNVVVVSVVGMLISLFL